MFSLTYAQDSVRLLTVSMFSSIYLLVYISRRLLHSVLLESRALFKRAGRGTSATIQDSSLRHGVMVGAGIGCKEYKEWKPRHETTPSMQRLRRRSSRCEIALYL